MAIISRQTGLLVAENWTKIYQTFREADFTTYDFETLRKSMIDYIKLYYPEDFNDFIESSEFIALIDLIAFLGQNLAFRTDLNARENFLDTAERRESVLKLARLISYNPKRSIPATGYLKIDSISTTENLFDSDGFNLSNNLIFWNDPANDSWLEQFTTILNAALTSSQIIGRPGNSQSLNGVTTDEYGINVVPNVVPIYRFETTVEGNRTSFEIVSATSINQNYIYEESPDFNKIFNLLYRNDNNGNASNNTGFFLYFKQGELSSLDFTIPESLPNKVVNVDINNINNNDFWLYSLNPDGSTQSLWRAVPSTYGINVIYNDIDERNLYQVNTRAGDQISLVFGDGSFSNIPQGNFRLYYRTGNGLSYRITPDEMRSISISMNYISRQNRIETLTFTASLKYTVANAATRESTEDIKQKAPQQYYTQNRMITGEDYNILPYTTFSKIVKAKAINRTSAGLSRYLDVLDTTGKYSSTNIFGQDGVLYYNNYVKTIRFKFSNVIEARKVFYNRVINDIVSGKELLHYYYSTSEKITASTVPTVPGNLVVGKRYIINEIGTTDWTEVGAARNEVGLNFIATETGENTGLGQGSAWEASVTWNLSTVGSNSSTGYFVRNDLPLSLSLGAGANTKYLRTGATIRFLAPSGYHFNAANTLVQGPPNQPDDRTEMFASVVEVLGDGSNNGAGNFTNGSGPVTLNTKVPSNAIVDIVIPAFKNNFGSGFSGSVITNIIGYKNFGLSYSAIAQAWRLITALDLQTDESWMIKFEYNNNTEEYVISYKGIEYIFHSPAETTFYFDESLKIYDSKTASVVQDTVKIVKSNTRPDQPLPLGKDCAWAVYKKFVDSDGYVDNSRIYLTYSDSDNDSVPDDPTLFEFIVNPTVNLEAKRVFFREETGTDYNKYMNLRLVPRGDIVSVYPTRQDILNNITLYDIGQLFYATTEQAFYSVIYNEQLGATANTLSNALTRYVSYIGRQNLYYQYRHNSPNTRRIDPSISNIIDLYVLTASYDQSYRQWALDTSNTVQQPSPPTNAELSAEFAELNNLKSISDTIVFQSAVYKPIFGSKSNVNLQAVFKVVKNTNLNISDSEIKTSMIDAINSYFDVQNWDFGETFYFSELAAYLHKQLSPNVASVIIVPKDPSIKFGNLQQINSEPNEIIISCATVDDIEIITAVTASQLNQGIATVI
jgi:hypothetical protein